MNENNNRFSILTLEKDMTEYIYYKTKFNEYATKSKSTWHYFSRSKNERLKIEFYTKYIAKMHYQNNISKYKYQTTIMVIYSWVRTNTSVTNSFDLKFVYLIIHLP